jgi:hypothetical protein
MTIPQDQLIRYAILGLEHQLHANYEERQRLTAALNDLRGKAGIENALDALQYAKGLLEDPTPTPPPDKPTRAKPKISAAGRKRIAEAQRARWAARKADKAKASARAEMIKKLPRHRRGGLALAPPPTAATA